MQKMNLNLFLSPYTKTNSKRITEVGVGERITDLNVTLGTTNILEENRRGKVTSFSFSSMTDLKIPYHSLYEKSQSKYLVIVHK